MTIRRIRSDEYEQLGNLMVEVYSKLEGFPGPLEQPAYYEMLQNIGKLDQPDGIQVLVAVNDNTAIMGGIVYVSDMSLYGSGGAAPNEKNASGIRLLVVDPDFRGGGVAKSLTKHCIELTRENRHEQVILHTTRAMQMAWNMYERMGFQRSPDLDFLQSGFQVFGFRLFL